MRSEADAAPPRNGPAGLRSFPHPEGHRGGARRGGQRHAWVGPTTETRVWIRASQSEEIVIENLTIIIIVDDKESGMTQEPSHNSYQILLEAVLEHYHR